MSSPPVTSAGIPSDGLHMFQSVVTQGHCQSVPTQHLVPSGKHESDRQRFRILVPSCPCFITGGDTHSLCVACLGEEHPWGGTTHSILSLNRGFRDHPPVQRSLYEKIVCHCLPHRCFYTSWLLRHLHRWHQQGFPRMDYTFQSVVTQGHCQSIPTQHLVPSGNHGYICNLGRSSTGGNKKCSHSRKTWKVREF